MKAISKICSAVLLVSFGSAAQATDCSQWPHFSSTEDYLEPLSVPATKIGQHLTASEHADGIVFSSRRRGADIWLDIETYPGATVAIAGTRAIMIAGRLMDENFKRLMLEDDGTPIFAISEPDLRAVGCQFIWASEGGQNPIALMREFYKAMVWYEDGAPLSDQWNGSLMGDSTLAARLNAEALIPKWIMSAVDMQ